MNGNNLFSIGEMAKAIGITRKIILNYETKGLIKPDKKDGATGNRYYTIDTFTKIRTIRVFQDFGLSLDEIREYLDDLSDLEPMIKRLENMRDELNLTIEKLKERANGSKGIVREVEIEAQTVYVRKFKSETVGAKTNCLRETALEAMRTFGTDTTRRMYFTEYNEKTPDEVTYCVSVPQESEGEGILKIPLIKGIAIFHHGAYEEIPSARKKLVEYAEKNNVKLSGIFRNLYIEGPPQHKDKSKFITQVIALLD